ncbi:hypothetical protein ACLB2K_028077 [Fragaria x ananassa]
MEGRGCILIKRSYFCCVLHGILVIGEKRKIYNFRRKRQAGKGLGSDQIKLKLIVNNSKKVVCYAEAGEDFGRIDHLYKSVKDLD